MIWAIAIRNLWQHKTKTMIIGVLVTLGIMLSFVGNAFIDSMIKNISGIFTDYYTGDILVTSTETLGAGVFGAQSDDVVGFPVIPVLKDYDKGMEIVSGVKGVKSVTHQLSGYAMLNLEKEGIEYACFFGVEPGSYFKTMPDIQIVDGRMLKDGEEGMLLHYDIWKKIKEKKNIEYKIGDKIQLNNFGTGGMKIREVPLVGIFKFPRGNQRMFAMSFLDSKNLRYLLGKNSGKQEKVEVSADATALINSDTSDIDSLFGDAFPADTSSSSASSAQAKAGSRPVAVNANNVYDILGDKKPAAVQDVDQKDLSWHFILVRAEKGANIDAMIKEMNRKFDDGDLLLRAQGWWVSAMPDSLTYSGIKLLFNVAVFILGFVSIIIIMNTLVVSVMERTSEIGTMRALGAQKSFVTKMFIAETGFITIVFGFLGMALGAIVILALNRVGIPTDSDALRYLGGGGILRPEIGSQPVILSFCFMALIALLSWIYPVIIALKISPLKAITTE
jgi:putative ABC transport system permease protein